MNRVFLVGNITGDIYYDRHLIKGQERSYLRLILMTSRPRLLQGMRIVLWDQKADLYCSYLQKGSEIAVVGQLQSRIFRGKLVHEVEAENLILLRNIDWENGEQARLKYNWTAPATNANSVFVVGEVLEDIYFDWFRRSTEKGGGEYAFLGFMLNSDEYLKGLRVTVHGTLAELAFPYL
jgi:single-stranded DNA-binding protein